MYSVFSASLKKKYQINGKHRSLPNVSQYEIICKVDYYGWFLQSTFSSRSRSMLNPAQCSTANNIHQSSKVTIDWPGKWSFITDQLTTNYKSNHAVQINIRPHLYSWLRSQHSMTSIKKNVVAITKLDCTVRKQCTLCVFCFFCMWNVGLGVIFASKIPAFTF